MVHARHRNRPVTAPLIIAVIAVVVLAVAMIPEIRWAILGADYSRRMYVTIEVFAALTLINVTYAAVRKSWAAAVVSLAWLFAGVINSVV